MSVLLLRLAAPLQSWGNDSRFNTRRTSKEPSKSGLIGLIAASMGIKRNEDEKIYELTKLKIGIRTDKEGKLIQDFQVTDPGNERKLVLSYRHYLSDAVFVVGLESEDKDLLTKIEYSLKHPAFPLFLGRRSCPPAGQLCLGIREGSLEDVLTKEPLHYEYNEYNRPSNIRIVLDSNDPNNRNEIRDVPISFNPEHRKYGFRKVRQKLIDFPDDKKSTDHDPLSELE